MADAGAERNKQGSVPKNTPVKRPTLLGRDVGRHGSTIRANADLGGVSCGPADCRTEEASGLSFGRIGALPWSNTDQGTRTVGCTALAVARSVNTKARTPAMKRTARSYA